MPELTVAAKQNIEQAFDDSATTYDRVGPAIYEPFAQRLADWLPLKPGGRCLMSPRVRVQYFCRQHGCWDRKGI